MYAHLSRRCVASARSAAREHDARAEFLGRIGIRSEHRDVAVDPGIDERRVALVRIRGGQNCRCGRSQRDDRNPVPVACCEYRELEGTAPGVWREDRAYVAPANFEERTTRNVLGCKYLRGLRRCSYEGVP